MVDFATIVVGTLADRPMKSILEQLWPGPDRLIADVDRLIDGQEKLLLAPFRRALSELRLGDLSAARGFLLDAESHNLLAPALELLLAAVLVQTGAPREEADMRVRATLALNPFLVPSSFYRGRRQIAPPGSRPQESVQSLSALRVARNGKVTKTWRKPSSTAPYTPVMRQVAVSSGQSPGSGTVIVMCQSGQEDMIRRGRYIRWAIAFNLADGHVQWGMAGPRAHGELVLVSPSVVVVELERNRRPSFEILDIKTGDHLETMSAVAFQLLFGPRGTDRESSEAYNRSHRTFDTPLTANYYESFAKTSAEVAPYRVDYFNDDIPEIAAKLTRRYKSLLGGGPRRADPVIKTESHHLYDPTNPNGPVILTARNTYRSHQYSIIADSMAFEAELRFWPAC